MHLRHVTVYAASCLILFVLFTATSSAQTAQPPSTPTPSVQPTLTPQPTTTPQPDPEVLILRAQLQQMQDTDNRLLNVVYWTLSLVGGLAALLIGYNWFTNKWQYDHDKTMMRNELTAFITNEMKIQKVAMLTVFENLHKEDQELLEEHIEAVKWSTNRSIKRIEEKMMSEELMETIETGKRLTEEKNYERAFNCFFSVISQVCREIKSQISDKEEYKYYHRSFDYEISTSLYGIQCALSGGHIPNTYTAGTLRSYKQFIPDEYHAEMEIIEDMLKSAVIKENSEQSSDKDNKEGAVLASGDKSVS